MTTGQPDLATVQSLTHGEVVATTVDEHVGKLQWGYRADHATAVSALARIKRGAGTLPGEDPELWGLTGMEGLFRNDVFGEDEYLERAEVAVHLAVTLWALHQTSHRSKGMHFDGGPELGAAVRRLMPDDTLEHPVRRHFVRVGTATSLGVLAPRLRTLVLLLRRDLVPLDYGRLAEQIYQWQQPGGPNRVRSAWGRGFHAYRPAADRDVGPEDRSTAESDSDRPDGDATDDPTDDDL